MNIKKLTLMAMLLSMSLVIFIVEAQVPPIVPIPGIKLGLANVINLMALYMLGRKESFIILILRVFLSGVFTGNLMSLLYSISGGIISFLFMVIISLFIKENRMWVISVFGAMGHNIGQITIAYLIIRNPHMIWYVPILIISAVITGIFTGVISQIVLKLLRKSNIINEISKGNTHA